MLTNCSCSDCLGVITIPCCSTVQLPISTNKCYILYNDMTKSTIATHGSEQSFSLTKSYTLPYTQLSNNGDVIEITALFEVMAEKDTYVNIKYDNVAICTWRIAETHVVTHILARAIINRVSGSTSSNNLLCTGTADYVYYTGGNYADMLGQGKIYQTLTKQFGTAPGLNIECKGYLDAAVSATNYIDCKQLCVKYTGI